MLTGHPIILYGSMYTNYTTRIDEVNSYTQLEDKSILSKGSEVIIPSSGESAQDISRASVVNIPNVILGGDLNIITLKGSLEPEFLALNITNGASKKKIMRLAQGKSVVHIRNNDLKNVPVFHPSKNEQSRISDFIISIEKNITLHQRKLDKLKDLKEVYLQNLLPEKNNRVPNIRFAGFCKEWEKRKLEEIAKITMGQAPKSENYTDKANDYILVQGNADLRDGKVVPRVWTTQITKKAEVGDILISVRAPVGEVGITGFPIVLGRGVASLKGNSFIYQTLKRMKNRNYWKKYSTGSTFESINSKDLKNATIYVPSKKEQSNIGNFCSKLDLMIGLHQEKSDKLNNIKNVYLQKLFV